MEQQESNFYRLKDSKQYPFNMSFEEFKKYYNKDSEWGKRTLWKEVLQSLDICDVNEPSEDRGVFNFPLKSSDLVYAYLSALYSKGEKKELASPPKDAEQYKNFISSFFNAIDKINPKDYLKDILYSNINIQYLKTNEVFLTPFIEKLSLLITIVLSDCSENRVEILSKILDKINDILADYVLDHPSLKIESQKNMSQRVHLEQTIQDVCKILKVDEKEFTNITDPQIKNKIKDYVFIYNSRKKQEEISSQEKAVKELYIQYLNINFNTPKQKNMAKDFISTLLDISSRKKEELYEKEVSNFLFEYICPESYLEKMSEYSLGKGPIPNQTIERFEMLYGKFLQGSDAYHRKILNEILNKLVSDITEIDSKFNFSRDIIEMMDHEYKKHIEKNKSYDYRNMNEPIDFIKKGLSERKEIIDKLNCDYWDPLKIEDNEDYNHIWNIIHEMDKKE